MAGVTSRFLMALGADRSADPLSWTLTDLTSRTQPGGVAKIARGRRSGSAQDAQPAECLMPLNNGDGALTPGYAGSTYHPDLVRGIPIVIDVEVGSPNLRLTGLTGSKVSTPDHATLDITGDITLAVEVDGPLRMPRRTTTAMDLIGKWGAAGQRSYLMAVSGLGLIYLFWTVDGTTQFSQFSQIAAPRYDSGPGVYAVHMDVDDGAGGREHKFYAGRGTIADWLAAPDDFLLWEQTTSGTTSIFSGSAVVELGDVPNSATFAASPGRFRRAVVISGTPAGSIVANPVFTAQTPGATSFTDSAGRLWTLGGDAAIDGHHTRLVGELAATKPGWPGHGVAGTGQVTWQVAGILRRLRQGDKTLQSALRRHVNFAIESGDLIHAYWPLEDDNEAANGASGLPGGFPLGVGGADWRWAADSTLIGSAPVPHVDGTVYFGGQIGAYTATQSMLDILVRIDTPNAAGSATVITAVQANGTAARWIFSIDDTNVSISASNAGGGSVFSTTFASDARMFDTWSIWSLNIEQDGGNVDWALTIVPTPLGVGFGTSGTFAGTVGEMTSVHSWGSSAPADGGISFAHVIVSTGKSIGWLAPADHGYTGEPAAQRFFRLAQEEHGIPTVIDAPYSFVWGATTGKPMGPQRTKTLLELLTECAVVERARIGEARELLGLTFRSYHHNQTPALTLTGELANPFQPSDDDQGVINDLTVTRPSASSYHLTDDESIAQVGVFEHSLTANVEEDLQLPDLASWVLAEALPEEMRVPTLQIELGKDSAQFDDWTATRPGDLIVADTVPPHFPDEEVRQLLDGYVEEISRTHWRVKMNGTPAGVWEVGVRDDDALGIRDTGGSVLDAAFDAGTDTSMDVETTLGPLWAVTAASNSALPFDVNVGGFRITVTAIGAAAGQVQTFTVTQTPVNLPTVTKTIPAGTAVSVWRPARRAYSTKRTP